MTNLFSSMLFKFWPKRAQIEITTRCNLNCIMCPRKKLGLKEADMNLEAFCKIIDKLSSVREITLSGWGEPLMHPGIDKMIGYCKSKDKRIKLTTNGLLISSNNINVLNDIDEVNFSIDEISSRGKASLGHYDNNVFLKIKDLVMLRGKNKKPFIRIQTIYYGNNKDDIFKILHMAKDIGVDSVKIMRVNSIYAVNLPRIGSQEILRFYKDILQLAKKIKVRVDLINYSFASGLKNIFYKIFIYIISPLTGIKCTKVLNFAYITVDGKVLPTGCGELYNYIIGDILKEDLCDIWRKNEFSNFRKNHMAFCSPDCIFLMN